MAQEESGTRFPLNILNGEKVEALLNNPEVMQALDLAVILTLRSLQFTRTAVRDITDEQYMVYSNALSDQDGWIVRLPPEHLKFFK